MNVPPTPPTHAGRYDVEAIKRRLPHRYPFLMVDRIEESGPGYAIGIKNVTVNEPCFQGHFPEHSIMPGVLIAEALMQTSAFIDHVTTAADRDKAEAIGAGRQFFCIGMNLKFHKPVTPGDRLRMDTRLVRRVQNMVRIKATAQTEIGVVASGELNLAAIDQEHET